MVTSERPDIRTVTTSSNRTSGDSKMNRAVYPSGVQEARTIAVDLSLPPSLGGGSDPSDGLDVLGGGVLALTLSLVLAGLDWD